MCSTRPYAPRPTRCAVCRVGYSLPFITPPRPTDCRYAPSRGIRQPAGKYVLVYPWGAPRLRAAALSSLPACAPFPQRRAISRAFPCTRRPRSAEWLPLPIRARLWALAPLAPDGICGGYHPNGVRARCGRTRPATQAAVRIICRRSSVAGVPLRGQYAHASTKKSPYGWSGQVRTIKRD